MSELINIPLEQGAVRWRLLGSASAFTLMGLLCAVDASASDDESHPTVWVELGGQLERDGGGQEAFAPPFVSQLRTDTFKQPSQIEKLPLYSSGGEAKIHFEPNATDWKFSAGVRYGRSNASKHVHQQTIRSPFVVYAFPSQGHHTVSPTVARFADTRVTHSESHAIVDFQVGRDIGLGLFGSERSVLNLGVRFAQFSSRSTIHLQAIPDLIEKNFFSRFPFPNKYYQVTGYHRFDGTAHDSRSFRGVGPSLSWDDSMSIAGNKESNGITFDWGINAAVLFGRQRASADHQTSSRYRSPAPHPHLGTQGYYTHLGPNSNRARNVVVPNVGGFASVSFKYPNAKVSIGYRGDFFFSAMDGGIDMHKAYDRNFYGPFATVSIGLP